MSSGVPIGLNERLLLKKSHLCPGAGGVEAEYLFSYCSGMVLYSMFFPAGRVHQLCGEGRAW